MKKSKQRIGQLKVHTARMMVMHHRARKSKTRSSLYAPLQRLYPHRFLVAPIVGASEQASEPAFRILCRNCGSDLCYSPMLPAHQLANPTFRQEYFPDTELRIHVLLQLPNDDDTKLSLLSLRPSSVTSVAMIRRRSSLQPSISGVCGNRSQFGVSPTYSVRGSVRSIPTGLCGPVSAVSVYRFPPS